jgi:hypothetical protein
VTADRTRLVQLVSRRDLVEAAQRAHDVLARVGHRRNVPPVVALREQHRRLTWLAAELYYGVQAVLEDWRQWRADCRQINEEHDRYVAEHRE